MSHEKDKTAPLATEYLAWCKTNNLEAMSADELMYEISCKANLTDTEQSYIDWLAAFIERWDAAVQS